MNLVFGIIVLGAVVSGYALMEIYNQILKRREERRLRAARLKDDVEWENALEHHRAVYGLDRVNDRMEFSEIRRSLRRSNYMPPWMYQPVEPEPLERPFDQDVD